MLIIFDKMELKLDRNEKNAYELCYKDLVLSESFVLAEVMGQAEAFAKKFQKKLYVSEAALSDWFVGFPVNKEEAPLAFFDPSYLVRSSQQSDERFRFVEGPFLTKEAAFDAAFRISGQTAVEGEGDKS